jgi:hypothetical protein
VAANLLVLVPPLQHLVRVNLLILVLPPVLPLHLDLALLRQLHLKLALLRQLHLKLALL